MTSMEAKREQFRKYLERCGLLDALCKALIKLYEEPNKPDDAIRFVRKYMCESCPDDQEYELLKHDLHSANEKISLLEIELERFKGNLKRTPSEIANMLETGWEQLVADEECGKSLLRKYLTRDVLDEAMTYKTMDGATLLDCILSGLVHHNSKIGMYAADLESYDMFKTLFDPVILEYHDLQENTAANLQPAVDWGNMGEIRNLDTDGKYIVSTRIRTSRNLAEYPFFAILSEEQFYAIEEKIVSVVEGFEGELKGTYMSIKNIDFDTQQEMVKRHILFKKGDEYLSTAGAYRFWPSGRGIFYTPSEDFMIWVNEEDHMRVISICRSGDLNEAYTRLVGGIKALEEELKFMRHPRYGNVSACPTNVGTSLRASVHIRLPLLSKDPEKLQQITNRLKLQIRGTSGEHTAIEDGVMDISNICRLGATEFEVIKSLQDGIVELIKAEEELA